MATKKQKEQLMQTLKFTPRTYTVMLSGYGGEIVLGSVPRKQYEYFRDNNIDIEEFASDWDNESEVPEEMQPFEPGSWHECDDVAHENGCELSDSNYITGARGTTSVSVMAMIPTSVLPSVSLVLWRTRMWLTWRVGLCTVWCVQRMGKPSPGVTMMRDRLVTIPL